jgi:hypothetical protein
MHSRSNSHLAADASAVRAPLHKIPRWVKVFGVIAAIAIAAFIVDHLAGGGMRHIGHGNMVTMPYEQDQHTR